jgi:hypothetical protein
MKTCDSADCDMLPVFDVFWPGQEKAFCVACTQRAKNVAASMGFDLSYRLRPTDLNDLLTTDEETP